MDSSQSLRVVFAGTPAFACRALEAIHAAGFVIPLVLTQPDRPSGRGLRLMPGPVKEFAMAHGIPVLQPTSLRRRGKTPAEAQAALEALQATPCDVMVVAAYGLILPKEVLDMPPLGCLNIHASLLPRWRGAAPIQRAIAAGDAQTGVTLMRMGVGLDTGPMLRCATLPISPEETAGSLTDKLATMGARMMVELLRDLARGHTVSAIAQPEVGITYAEKIQKSEARLDFSLTAEVLSYKVRAFNPAPAASAEIDGVSIKCLQAHAISTSHVAPSGTILSADDGGVLIACGEQTALCVTRLQKAGGKVLEARLFLQGFRLQAGQRFVSPSPSCP